MSATEKREFGELDPNLPTIAALAAAEIDAIQQEKPTDAAHLRQLAGVLSATLTSSPENSSDSMLRLLDPVASGVISKAVTDFASSKPESYDDVVRISADLAKEMQSVDAIDPKLLAKLKVFCLAISRYSLASRKTPNQKRVSKYRRAYP